MFLCVAVALERLNEKGGAFVVLVERECISWQVLVVKFLWGIASGKVLDEYISGHAHMVFCE